MVGQTISHYKILKKLGEGGMGVVYKAEDLVLHRMVALKFPSGPFVHDDGIRARLLNEARMAAHLIHQNVTVIHSVGEYDGKPYIVMEYVDGFTLHHAICEDGPLPLKQFISIALQLCEGIRAVHEKMVLHRDIKTQNILLTNTNQVKIADCGLAARFIDAEGLAEQLGVAGTTAYMSPEQIRGERLDRRSDIFSVGVVLYEMLTGHLPFEAKAPSALTYLIMNVDPAPLSTNRNDIPMELTDIVSRALEKDRSKRYENITQIIDALQNLARTIHTQ